MENAQSKGRTERNVLKFTSDGWAGLFCSGKYR